MTRKLTRERIQRIIRAIDSEAYDEEEIREWLSSDEIMELSRMALAAMDSEPVAVIDLANLDYLLSGAHADVWPPEREEMGDVLLYRHAQPAPEVPDEKDKTVDADDHPLLWSFNEGWNACRAAMLQAGNSPAQSYCCQAQNSVSPAQSPIDHGYRPECECSGCKATARICAELAGNSQVIPDGYVMVPKEPTKEMLDEFDSINDYGAEDSQDAWRRLLAATPQLPGSEPATVPGKWIPVSERMPDEDTDVLVYCSDTEEQFVAYHNCNGYFHYATYEKKGEGYVDIVCNPTHWMPLPAPPQEVKK